MMVVEPGLGMDDSQALPFSQMDWRKGWRGSLFKISPMGKMKAPRVGRPDSLFRRLVS